MKLKAVVFDLFITLTDFENERRRPDDMVELAAVLGVDRNAFVSVFRSTFTERATGQMGDLRSTMRTVAVMLNASVTEGALAHACDLRMEHERRITQPREGVVAAIEQLRETGLRTGLLSDCTPEIGELWDELPYKDLFDARMLSFERGLRKPASELYVELAASLGVQPTDCLYVGDGGSNELSGAEAVGMTPVLLQTPLEDTFRYDAETGWNGHTVESIEGVEQLVSRLNRPA